MLHLRRGHEKHVMAVAHVALTPTVTKLYFMSWLRGDLERISTGSCWHTEKLIQIVET